MSRDTGRQDNCSEVQLMLRVGLRQRSCAHTFAKQGHLLSSACLFGYYRASCRPDAVLSGQLLMQHGQRTRYTVAAALDTG